MMIIQLRAPEVREMSASRLGEISKLLLDTHMGGICTKEYYQKNTFANNLLFIEI